MGESIKFRAWDEESQQMIYPDSGTITSGDILNRYKKVMQFTGLIDKNGNEVWQSDIVTMQIGNEESEGIYNVYVVRYLRPLARYVLFCIHSNDRERVGKFLSNSVNQTIMIKQRYVKVIGNTHENPELLNIE